MSRLSHCLAIAALLGAALISLGNVFPDEGWYLYAGRLVAQGQVPYRDFAHFQAPLGPYLFALAGGSRLAGRALCLALGLGAIALALDLARRRGDDALIATALVLVPATYTLRWYAVARNIAPAAFFLMLGVWLRARRSALAPASMAVAAALRLSALGGLAALVLDDVADGDRRRAARTALAGAAALALLLAPFALAGGDLVAFNLLLYHTGLHAPAGALEQLASKLQGLLRLADHHHLLVLALLVAARRRDRSMRLPFLTAACVTALHLIPGRLHPEYHELVVPQLALIAGLACAPFVRRFPARGLARFAIAALLVLQLAGARNQLHTATGWSPSLIGDVAVRLALIAPPSEPVITFVPDFALAAGRPLLPGLEMASASLARPDVDERTCLRYHMLTLPMLARALREQRASAVVWRALDDADPRRVSLYPPAAVGEVEAALRSGYERTEECHGWSLWRRRTLTSPAAPRYFTPRERKETRSCRSSRTCETCSRTPPRSNPTSSSPIRRSSKISASRRSRSWSS